MVETVAIIIFCAIVFIYVFCVSSPDRSSKKANEKNDNMFSESIEMDKDADLSKEGNTERENDDNSSEQKLLDESYRMIYDWADKEISVNSFHAKYAFINMGDSCHFNNIYEICDWNYLSNSSADYIYYHKDTEPFKRECLEKESKIVAKLIIYLQETYPNMRFYIAGCFRNLNGIIMLSIYFTTSSDTKKLVLQDGDVKELIYLDDKNFNIKLKNVYFPKADFFKTRVIEYLLLFNKVYKNGKQ